VISSHEKTFGLYCLLSKNSRTPTHAVEYRKSVDFLIPGNLWFEAVNKKYIKEMQMELQTRFDRPMVFDY
jgi:hypothetical protein